MPISHPFDSPPAAGVAFPVAPGIAWLRMPLPFALDHINLWLLDDGPASVAVDAGIALDAVRDAWKSALAGRRLTRQIVTHFHPDHLGLAAWLEAETGAPLWMSQGDYLTAQAVAAGLPPFDIPTLVTFFRRHGLDAAGCEALDRRGNAYRRGVPAIPDSFRRLREGDSLVIGGRHWRVIVGHGHAPEHVSLYCEALRVLISGDMLLPRISTNISVFAACPDDDSLGDFLASLERLKMLPADTLVLPSHGLPFRGVHERIAQLRDHHAVRCADLCAACGTRPASAAELIPTLFGRPIADAHQIMFAMGEAIAHLNHLERQGLVRRVTEDGVIRYASPHDNKPD